VNDQPYILEGLLKLGCDTFEKKKIEEKLASPFSYNFLENIEFIMLLEK
jgi:hypothetical protein